MEVSEKTTYLPNPEAHREPCIDKCMGCNKVFTKQVVNIESTILVEEDVCIAYAKPEKMHRLGHCALASNKQLQTQEKKKVNPLKASKRSKRRK